MKKKELSILIISLVLIIWVIAAYKFQPKDGAETTESHSVSTTKKSTTTTYHSLRTKKTDQMIPIATKEVVTTKPTTTKPSNTKPTTTMPATTKPATTLSREEENFRNLTMDDKADIVEWIQSTIGTNIDTDELWAEIAEEYGITEEMVDRINMDPDVAYAIGRRNKARNEESRNSIQYDATLSYGSGTVAIGETKEDLDEFLDNIANYDTSANSVMVYEGRLALVDEGTKVKVLERKLTTTKVRVLEGLFEGFEGWTIMEAVNYN